MSPQDFIELLSARNINVTARTILNYEFDSLIPKPQRDSRPDGSGGKSTDYPPEALYEFIASHKIMHGPEIKVSKQLAARARAEALKMIETKWDKESFMTALMSNLQNFMLAYHWLSYKDKAEDASKGSNKSIYYVLGKSGKLVKRTEELETGQLEKIGVVWE